MLRILAFSDLHANFSDLERLIQLEFNNSFDAILSAGDIGSYESSETTATKILQRLSIFKCPIYFVLGNSDPESDSPEQARFPDNSILLSHHPVLLGDDYILVGLNLFKNVFLNRTTNEEQLQIELNSIYDSIKSFSSSKYIILLSHNRIYKLNYYLRDNMPLIFMYGHYHQPHHRISQQTNFINCSALDQSSICWGAGIYCIIEIKENMVTTTPKPLNLPTRGCRFSSHWKKRSSLKIYNEVYPDLSMPLPKKGEICINAVGWHS